MKMSAIVRWSILRVTVFLGLLVVCVVYLLKPIVQIRIGELIYSRIGHLVPNTEIYLRRQKVKKKRGWEVTLFLCAPPKYQANRQAVKMIRRQSMIWTSRLAPLLYNELRRLIPWCSIWLDIPFLTNEYDIFSNVPPQLSFTQDEHLDGQKTLLEMGITEKDKFVCFHSHDSSYLDKFHTERTPEEWSYNDYKNCDIDTYLPAVRFLASRRYFALRMGKAVEKKLPPQLEKTIIDYACEFRSDFGDMYLLANCTFFLGNSSGPWTVATSFGVPIACANFVPISLTPLTPGSLFIPKKYWDIERKRFLTIRELISIKGDRWQRSELYQKAGIEPIDNTSEEILMLAKEMHGRLNSKWIQTDEDDELQRRYWASFPSGYLAGVSFHGQVKTTIAECPSRVGRDFLKEHSFLLE